MSTPPTAPPLDLVVLGHGDEIPAWIDLVEDRADIAETLDGYDFRDGIGSLLAMRACGQVWTFDRDLSWIEGWIEAAYSEGFARGVAAARPPPTADVLRVTPAGAVDFWALDPSEAEIRRWSLGVHVQGDDPFWALLRGGELYDYPETLADLRGMFPDGVYASLEACLGAGTRHPIDSAIELAAARVGTTLAALAAAEPPAEEVAVRTLGRGAPGATR